MNITVLVGRVGKSVTVHQGEKKVASFTLATHTYFTKDGKSEKRTEWHKVVAYGAMADFAARNLYKGRLIAILGYNYPSKWEDQNGQIHYNQDVVVRHIELLEKREGGQNDK